MRKEKLKKRLISAESRDAEAARQLSIRIKELDTAIGNYEQSVSQQGRITGEIMLLTELIDKLDREEKKMSKTMECSLCGKTKKTDNLFKNCSTMEKGVIFEATVRPCNPKETVAAVCNECQADVFRRLASQMGRR